MFEKILVCLDGSKLAEQILPYAVEQALRLDSKVVLLRVVVDPVVVAAGAVIPVPASAIPEETQEEESEARAYLDSVAKPLRQKGVDIELVTLYGTAGEAIVRYARDKGMGLIAMATHGRSGLGRAVFGSVADFVLRESGLPILVIKPKESVT